MLRLYDKIQQTCLNLSSLDKKKSLSLQILYAGVRWPKRQPQQLGGGQTSLYVRSQKKNAVSLFFSLTHTHKAQAVRKGDKEREGGLECGRTRETDHGGTKGGNERENRLREQDRPEQVREGESNTGKIIQPSG